MIIYPINRVPATNAAETSISTQNMGHLTELNVISDAKSTNTIIKETT